MSERLAPLDYYKWHWKAFRLSRNAQRLHYVARGFYRELLDEQFAEGFIPDDIAALADICGCPVSVMQEHWPMLERFFPLSGDGQRVNPVQETHRTELDQKRAAQSRAGKASAAIRSKNTTDVRSVPTDVQSFRTNDERSSTDVQPEEKRREEKRESRGKKSSSRSEVASDDRFTPFREAFRSYFKFKNPSMEQEPWDGQEASHLSRFLKKNPSLTVEQWKIILTHRARSPVPHGESLSTWIAGALKWVEGPTNVYGRQATGGVNDGVSKAAEREQRNSAAAERLLARIDGAGGEVGSAAPGGDDPWPGSDGDDAGSVSGFTGRLLEG